MSHNCISRCHTAVPIQQYIKTSDVIQLPDIRCHTTVYPRVIQLYPSNSISRQVSYSCTHQTVYLDIRCQTAVPIKQYVWVSGGPHLYPPHISEYQVSYACTHQKYIWISGVTYLYLPNRISGYWVPLLYPPNRITDIRCRVQQCLSSNQV